jgi:hypothetical protein
LCQFLLCIFVEFKVEEKLLNNCLPRPRPMFATLKVLLL